MNLVQSIVLFGEAVSSKGVVLSQKRIFHNKQFLQKGFLTCICHLNVSSCCVSTLDEPCHEKTCFMHTIRKQRRRSAAQLIGALVFATYEML